DLLRHGAHPPGLKQERHQTWGASSSPAGLRTPGGEELFGGLSHAFTPGKVTAVTGPSGRGKSTLLYVLGLMLTPTRGQVLLGGEPVSAADATRSRVRAARIGFVFQDASLDPSRVVLDSV